MIPVGQTSDVRDRRVVRMISTCSGGSRRASWARTGFGVWSGGGRLAVKRNNSPGFLPFEGLRELHACVHTWCNVLPWESESDPLWQDLKERFLS